MTLRPARRLEGVNRTLIRRIFDAAPADAINLGLGQPDLPTPSTVALSGVAAIAGGRTGYTSTAGDEDLRRLVAAQYGEATDASGVVITVGSQEAMFACCMALLDPGDEVLYPNPGYPAYPTVARLIGAVPVGYRLSAEHAFRVRSADLTKGLTSRTRLVILTAPSNPTGACVDREELGRIISLLRERGVPWISDEIYSGFCYADDFVSPLTLAPRDGLVVSGLSKDMSMTGWRLGWVAGDPEIVSRIVAVHQHLVTCAPSITQRAAVAAFSDAGRAERSRYVEIFRRRRDLMAEELSGLKRARFEPPDGAFYYFVDVSEYGDDQQLARRVLDSRGVITIPGTAFGDGGRGVPEALVRGHGRAHPSGDRGPAGRARRTGSVLSGEAGFQRLGLLPYGLDELRVAVGVERHVLVE